MAFMVSYGRVVLRTAATLLLMMLPMPLPQASAATPTCGQPVSAGSAPSVVDALAILKSAVGGSTCGLKPCYCDVDGDSSVTATDALRALRRAVGLPAELSCPCDGCEDTGSCLACTSFRFSLRQGSEMDVAWSGLGHDVPWFTGEVFTADVLSRCAGSGDPCMDETDCEGGPCIPTCDCITDSTCEITGPTHPRHCLFDLSECEEDEDCHATANRCVAMLGPQLPVFGESPFCAMHFFDGDLTGTLDAASGELEWTARMKRYLVSGGFFPSPCAKCGDVGAEVGDAFTCNGGSAHGDACTVDAVHPYFGGLSYDCPRSAPDSSRNPVSLGAVTVTTHAVQQQAGLPCSGFLVDSHPTRGNAKCVDDGEPCSSNTDCLRCRDDVSISCTTDDDCGSNGPCLAAPGQPVTCGYWCHCGFCGGDATQPCFDDSQCSAGVSCEPEADASLDILPQPVPNDCTSDAYVCGGSEDGTCEETSTGRCELAPHNHCGSSTQCSNLNSGDCVQESQACFEPSIERSGSASVDVGGVIHSTAVALACAPGLPGSTGPVALSLNLEVDRCRCGDSIVGCSETCDDGNAVSGDGCSARCRPE